LAASAVMSIDTVVALGDHAAETLADFGNAFGLKIATDTTALASGEALCWRRHANEPASPIRLEHPRQYHKRHAGKYAVGDVGWEHSFYFHYPANGTKMRAENLYRFMEIASAVDDST